MSNNNANEEDEVEDEEEDNEDSDENDNDNESENENDNENLNTNLSLKDTTAPTISDVRIKDVAETSATVEWKTNESATGKVNYGVKSGTYTFGANSGGGTSHTARLSGLTSGAIYYYQVWSKDAAGNIATKTEQKLTTIAKSASAANASSSSNLNTDSAGEPVQSGGSVNMETVTTRTTNEGAAVAGDPGVQENVNVSLDTTVPFPLSVIRVGQTELPVPELVEGQAMIATSQTSTAVAEGSANAQGLVFPADRAVTFSGKTYPLTTVTVTVSSDPITKTTTSDADGRWELAFNETLEEGNHTVAVAVVNPTSKNVEESNPVKFSIIGTPRVLNDVAEAAGNADPFWIPPAVLYGILGVLAALLVIVLILIVSKWSKKSSRL